MGTGRFTWNRPYAYATTVAGTYTYAMPPDYAGGLVTLVDTTSGEEITFYPQAHFDMEYPDISSTADGEPEVFTVKGMELWIYPPTSGSLTLEMQYQRSGALNTATDFSFLPEVERWTEQIGYGFVANEAHETRKQDTQADDQGGPSHL